MGRQIYLGSRLKYLGGLSKSMCGKHKHLGYLTPSDSQRMRKPGTQIRIPTQNTLQGEGEGVFMVRWDFWWRHGTGHVVQLFILFFSPLIFPSGSSLDRCLKSSLYLAGSTDTFFFCLSFSSFNSPSPEEIEWEIAGQTLLSATGMMELWKWNCSLLNPMLLHK